MAQWWSCPLFPLDHPMCDLQMCSCFGNLFCLTLTAIIKLLAACVPSAHFMQNLDLIEFISRLPATILHPVFEQLNICLVHLSMCFFCIVSIRITLFRLL
jgi:hypothetical protein